MRAKRKRKRCESINGKNDVAETSANAKRGNDAKNAKRQRQTLL